MILREVKMRTPHVSMAWIDYKKAYDMVPLTWIINCLETVGINEKICCSLTKLKSCTERKMAMVKRGV